MKLTAALAILSLIFTAAAMVCASNEVRALLAASLVCGMWSGWRTAGLQRDAGMFE